ncbi:MAG: hypothetical protein Q9193_001450, partial [Seirophora villosa]
LLESAANLFSLLSNPSNISLLTFQLLSAPAIWHLPPHVETVVQVINVFSSASIRLLQRQEKSLATAYFNLQNRLKVGDWTVAVIEGVRAASPRSRHTLVFAGLLQGLTSQRPYPISRSLRTALQDALVVAANLGLRDGSQGTISIDVGLILAVSLAFESLDQRHKASLEHDLLLPVLSSALFFSDDGLHQGYFLSTIDSDVVEGLGQKFHWSTESSSYQQLRSMASSPLIAALGSLSRLAAFSIGQTQNLAVLTRLIQDVCEFSRSLSIQWRQNKLSEVDPSEEMLFLSDETLRSSVPFLWRILQTSMFAIVIILASCTERFLCNDFQRNHDAPSLAVQMLKIFHRLCFISSRLGTDTLSHHAFVYLAAVDVLLQDRTQAEEFLRDIQPAEIGQIPKHPLDRSMDRYFLITAEHFASILHTFAVKELLAPAASPYLSIDGDPKLFQIFEAAHCVMLAVLAAPHNIKYAVSQIEPYAGLLFQFRFAVKQLVRITSPPSLVSEQRPLLAATLLEALHTRLKRADSQPIYGLPEADADGSNTEPMSEQSALVHALIDALPFLSADELENWLPAAIKSIQLIQGPALRSAAKKSFWEVLSNGDMDCNRAAVCVTWWGTRGGRDLLLEDETNGNHAPTMSCALRGTSKL